MSSEQKDNTEHVQEQLTKHSKANIDEYVRASTFADEEVHEAIRGHIHLEWKSWFFFRKLAADSLRANVALHGFAALFKRAAAECFSDAMWLENYLVQRGGHAKPTDIPAPKISFPDSPVDPVVPVYESMQVEKELLEDLLRLCKTADKHGDYALEDQIENRFLKKETKHVKDMADLLQQCVRVSKSIGHGLYHLDRELRESKGIVPWAASNNPDNSDLLLAEAVSDLTEKAAFL
jgi:ferritin heavy chain